MERKKFPLQVNKQSIFAKYENNLKYITDKRNTHIDYFESEDERGRYLLPVIKFKILDKYNDIYHGFSSRLGGVSKGHLSALNLSFTRGDDRDNVLINHKRLGAALGYGIDTLVFSDQVHGNCIRAVARDDMGKGITRESDIIGVDGLVSNTPGVTLITFFADCVPNFFYDPVRRVVGLAHSGWKGTVKGIGTAMIERMADDFGSNPEDIVCAIGPSVCKNCYEVSSDVAQEFKAYYNDREYDSMIVDKGNGKFMLNLHMACKYNLMHAGVPEEHISLPDLCTCCNAEFLYSHRASNGMRGNLAAVIGIRE